MIFLQKPFASELLLNSVRRALAVRRLVVENRSLRLALSEQRLLGERLLGHSPSVQRLREQVSALANIQADVLILGETGSGKELWHVLCTIYQHAAMHPLSQSMQGRWPSQ